MGSRQAVEMPFDLSQEWDGDPCLGVSDSELESFSSCSKITNGECRSLDLLIRLGKGQGLGSIWNPTILQGHLKS